MTRHYDTILIGAGLAGLTAATQLAQAGKQVLLLERNAELGGRARTDDLDGTLFNQGAHALYRNGVGHRALRSIGVEPSGEPPPLAGGQLLLNGQTTALPLGATSLLSTRSMSARGKAQFARLLASLGRLNPDDYGDVTVDEWLRPHRDDVQEVLKAVIRLSTYAAATDLMSADAAISQLQGGDEGVLYLHDGWAALCRDIATRAVAAGATITSGVVVSAVRPTAAGFQVTTDGHVFEASTVIVAAGGPEFSARLLGIDAGSLTPVGPAPEAAVLDLVLEAMPARHRFIVGVDDPTYFSVFGPPARAGRQDRVSAVAMRYIAPDDDGTADEHRASLERIARAAGIDEPARSRFLRRMTVTNGLPVASQGGMRGRPSIEVPGMSGAFLAGDWVGPRGLLADAALASGVDAATAAAHAVPTLAGAH